jgi:transposase InsO family protein
MADSLYFEQFKKINFYMKLLITAISIYKSQPNYAVTKHTIFMIFWLRVRGTAHSQGKIKDWLPATYIPTDESWLYLAGVKDLFNGELVGYAMNMRE